MCDFFVSGMEGKKWKHFQRFSLSEYAKKKNEKKAFCQHV